MLKFFRESESVKKITVSENCIACGQCFSNFLVEQPNGKAAPAGIGFFTDLEAAEVQNFIESCPANAIHCENWLGEGDKKSRLDAIKKELANLENYQVYHPTAEEFECDVNTLQIALPSGNMRSRFSFRSNSQAESEGLRAFDQIAYSKRREIAQSVLIQYKKLYLNDYAINEQNDSCYYYREDKKIEQYLQALAKAVEEATGGKIIVPQELTQFQVYLKDFKYVAMPVHGFEETGALGTALEDVESLSWYDSWVDTDDKDLATRTVYCYDISGTVKELGNHIMSGCKSAVREGFDFVKQVVNWYQDLVTKELRTKIQGFNKILDSAG